ncbi:MAG: DUF2937 family protein [Bacteroidetes bacterium]|nr:DUF2937 family protein [Bacteroidota bacterium]
MKRKQWLLRKINGIFTVAAGLFGGMLFGQFPQFISQYIQRVGGHIDEARNIMNEYDIPEIAERIMSLEAGLNAITEAGPFTKLFVFIGHADWKIARKTWENFIPGITFDSEGITYIIVGGISAFLVFDLLKTIISAFLFPKRRDKESHSYKLNPK